jgi:hypothetical protein
MGRRSFEAVRGLMFKEAASSINGQRRELTPFLNMQKGLDIRWYHRRTKHITDR